jgi:transcriptional regulator with XRE-family HTH domain
MISEITEPVLKKHVGKNLQRIRVYLGMKQEALAADLGISQPAVSNIEQQEEIEDELLKKIADILGVSPDIIRRFDEDRAIYNINNNNYRDAKIAEGATAIVQQVNPVEKIVELYERLLKSEREKIEILMENKK